MILQSFVAIGIVEVEIIFFSLSRDLTEPRDNMVI